MFGRIHIIYRTPPTLILRGILRLFLQPRIKGDLPSTGPILLTADHVSYWDGPLLAIWLDRKAIFTVHPDFARSWFWSRWISFWCGLWRHDYLALSMQSPFGLRRLLQSPSETVICLFPEGAIRRRAGPPLPWQAGMRYLLEKRPELEHWHLTACPGLACPARSGARPCWHWKVEPVTKQAGSVDTDPAQSQPALGNRT